MALLALDPHTVSIPLAMLIVFGAAKLFAEVLERLGQPGIVGEILAGAVVGPSMLGWIEPNEVLTALSELGVMFLLFRVGLEVKSSELMKVGGTAFVVALTRCRGADGHGLGNHAGLGLPASRILFCRSCDGGYQCRHHRAGTRGERAASSGQRKDHPRRGRNR